MSNFQIPLNGSNHVSRERKQAFQDAINDKHVIDLNKKLIDTGQTNGKPTLASTQPDKLNNNPKTKKGNGKQLTNEGVNSIDMGLNHSIAHQTRTMEIHQQYLEQQGEFAKLINAVLDQQGKVLDNGASETTQEIIDTFQRSLDSFHQIREKGMEVHQQFLSQQAEFSHSFVRVLEKQYDLSNNGKGQFVERDQPVSVFQETNRVEIELEPLENPETVSEEIVLSPAESHEEISLEILTAALMRIVGDKTGYPPEMLEVEMDLEADLGIDSIKRVEILGALEEEFPSLPPADTEILSQTRTLAEIVEYLNNERSSSPSNVSIDNKPDVQKVETQPALIAEEHDSSETTSAPTGIALEDLTTTLLEIVAEKTGYPVEMLESNMDMEADLGIDSIKRVEILGAMEERVPGLPAVEADALSELRTLGEIVDMMSSSQVKPLSSINIEDDNKKKVNQSTLDTTPVELVSLPDPDFLDFPISRDRPILVTDEGSEFTANFAKSLIKNGWNVIIWSFPEVNLTRGDREISQDLIQIFPEDSSQETIQIKLNEIRETQGLLSGFVHLHPLTQNQEDFAESNRDLVKGVFFLAGALKTDLSDNQTVSRPVFLTVTRLDGQLGLNPSNSFQEASGLTGVVKTLHWEWPNVFCRAIDLDPVEDQETLIDWVVQEIHDPDRGLIEVGRSSTKRVTIDRVYQD